MSAALVILPGNHPVLHVVAVFPAAAFAQHDLNLSRTGVHNKPIIDLLLILGGVMCFFLKAEMLSNQVALD